MIDYRFILIWVALLLAFLAIWSNVRSFKTTVRSMPSPSSPNNPLSVLNDKKASKGGISKTSVRSMPSHSLLNDPLSWFYANTASTVGVINPDGVINALKVCSKHVLGNINIKQFPEPKKVRNSICRMDFLGYESSKLELYMINRIKNIMGMSTRTYCNFMNSEYVKSAVAEFLGAMARYQNLASFQGENVNTDIFSTMTYNITCLDGASELSTQYIEPLLGLTRHPKALCEGQNWLENLDYILLQSFQDNLFWRRMNDTGLIQYIGMDLGATTWERTEPTRTAWFYTQYEQRGVEFDRMLMWEGIEYENGEIWKFPEKYISSFQYFNIFAELNPNAEDNPLRILHKIAREEDFVMLKLDIDQPKEITIVLELLENPNAMAVVDEFFFEHHSKTPLMRRYWGWNVACTLMETYNIFLKLRHTGVRAHGWP